jgi:rhomboid protease GluP
VNDFLARIESAPVTAAVFVAYLAIAFLTDPMNPTTAQLIAYGGAVPMLVADGEGWRLLSCAFVHNGLLHLLFNSYMLLTAGTFLEQRLGSARYALLYVVSAVCGSVFAMFVMPLAGVVVGGSGALFGMFGAAVVLHMRSGRTLTDFLDTYNGRQLLMLIGINFALGFVLPNISNAGHLGGLVGGFVLTFCFLEQGRRAADRTSRVVQTAWIAVFVTWTWYVQAPAVRPDWLQLRIAEQPGDPRSLELMNAFHASTDGQLSLDEVRAARAWLAEAKREGLRRR